MVFLGQCSVDFYVLELHKDFGQTTHACVFLVYIMSIVCIQHSTVLFSAYKYYLLLWFFFRIILQFMRQRNVFNKKTKPFIAYVVPTLDYLPDLDYCNYRLYWKILSCLDMIDETTKRTWKYLIIYLCQISPGSGCSYLNFTTSHDHFRAWWP